MTIEQIGTGQIIVAGPVQPRQPDERSIISRILDRVRSMMSQVSVSSGPLLAPYGWSDPRWWSDDPATQALLPPPVTETSALGEPAFGRGVELIASTIAGVELVAYRWDPVQQIDVQLSPQPEILRDPDPMTTPWHYRFAAVNDLICWGNHFARLGAPNAEGWPRWLEPVDATQVELGRDDRGLLVWRIGGREIVPWGSLFHVSAGARSGHILGRGVIRQYRDAIGGLISTSQNARRYSRTGGMPSAVIQSNNTDLTQTQADQIKTKYRATIGVGSREPLILPQNLSFTPVVSDAEKQQMVEARQWDAQTAAMILGVPPHMLGLPGTSMTYQNIDQADIAWVRDTVDRWAKPIEAAWSKWLLPQGTAARHNWFGRTRTDQQTRVAIIAAEKAADLLTDAEARLAMNRPALPEAAAAPGDGDPNPDTVPGMGGQE